MRFSAVVVIGFLLHFLGSCSASLHESRPLHPPAKSPSGPPPVPSNATCQAVQDRVDCSGGLSSSAVLNLTEAMCQLRGCCYDAASKYPCFYGVEGQRAEVLHIVRSNHFDAGYLNFTANVINLYFNTYFPRAAALGRELRGLSPDGVNGTLGAGQPLRWMTFSYLLSLFFDCPPGMGLACPSEAAVEEVRIAVQAQDIVIPAFPFNAEMAAADPSLLRFGVQMSQQLARDLGAPVPGVVSTRDVPGMARAAVGALAAAGATGLSQGMNGRMRPLHVPPAFRWASSDGATALPTLWHWAGYGRRGEPGNPLRIPGSRHAIAYCWRGDNAGPPESVAEVFDDARYFLGQLAAAEGSAGAGGAPARVLSATLDSSVAAISADKSPGGHTPWDRLPLVSQDLSDSWIWGVASDPVKMQRMRALFRVRSACEAAAGPAPAGPLVAALSTHAPSNHTQRGPELRAWSRRLLGGGGGAGYCTAGDAEFRNFSRLVMKGAEHTWGLSKFHLGPMADRGWSNRDLRADLAANQSNWLEFVRSWQEQRDFSVNYPLEALSAQHPVRAAAEAELRALEVARAPDPSQEGFTRVRGPLDASLWALGAGGWAAVTLGADGSLTGLKTVLNGTTAYWADANHSLARLQYETLVLDQLQRWQEEYLVPGTGGQDEYGKPASFMQATPPPQRHLAAPKLTKVWRRDSGQGAMAGSCLLARLEFESELYTEYGAPREAWLRYTFQAPGVVQVEVELLEVSATRLPEALFLRFRPQGSEGGAWAQSVLHQWEDPRAVAEGAARGLHYVSEAGVHLHRTSPAQWAEGEWAEGARGSTGAGGGSIQVRSLDTGLVRWGEPLPFPTPLYTDADLGQGAAYCLKNNIWNTNYPLWFPFDDIGRNLRFRFEIVITS